MQALRGRLRSLLSYYEKKRNNILKNYKFDYTVKSRLLQGKMMNINKKLKILIYYFSPLLFHIIRHILKF